MYVVSSRTLLLLFGFTIFSISLAFGQKKEKKVSQRKMRQIEATKHIDALKEGVLIVRLPGNQKKMQALQNLLDDPKLDKRNQSRLAEKLEITQEQTKAFNNAIHTAFQENYTYSEVYFMLDTATAMVKQGHTNGFLLDENLELAPDLSLPENKPRYVLRIGKTQTPGAIGIDAMILMDSEFQDLEKPFPYYARLNHFNAFLGGLFPKKNQLLKDTKRSVNTLNKQLEGFYRYVHEEMNR